MTYLNWDSSKDIGHLVIDGDHRGMADCINKLAELAFQDDGSPDRQAHIAAAAEELRRVSADHFQAEQAIMVMAGYPGLVAHRRQHEDLMAEYAGFIGFLSSPQEALAPKVIDFLRDWFVIHVQTWDVPLATWLAARPDY